MRLLHMRTFARNETDAGFEKLLTPWAAQVSPERMLISDPYLASVPRASELYALVAHCETSEELPDIPPERLESATSLWLVQEAFVAVGMVSAVSSAPNAVALWRR